MGLLLLPGLPGLLVLLPPRRRPLRPLLPMATTLLLPQARLEGTGEDPAEAGAEAAAMAVDRVRRA